MHMYTCVSVCLCVSYRVYVFACGILAYLAMRLAKINVIIEALHSRSSTPDKNTDIKLYALQH